MCKRAKQSDTVLQRIRPETRKVLVKLAGHDHRSNLVDELDALVAEACIQRGLDPNTGAASAAVAPIGAES